MKSLEDTLDRTCSDYVISSMREPLTFVNDVSGKIPPDWSVCILSPFKNGKLVNVELSCST